MAETNNKKKVEDYGSFNYSDYAESDSVKQAKDNLNSLQKPGAYQSQWQQGLNDAMNKIMNREKFSYDLNGDALYQQYKNQAVLGGQMAMQDTIGQASAMTGGYGNSYAQGVGQQAYQGYLQQLNDKVPELYQLALDQYNREGEDLYSQYGLLADRENTDYGRYRDTVSDYNTERGYLTDQYNTERNFDYSKYSDDRSFNYGVFSDDRNLQYQVDRDAVADSQWQQTYDEGVRQFDESMAFDKEQFDFTKDSWNKEFNQSVKQWEAEFNQSVQQFDKEYKLKVRQIEEDERNGKVSREVAQREIALAEQKHQADIQQASAELSYKYAALEAEERQANADRKYKYDALNASKEDDSGDPTIPPTPKPDTFDGWGASEWNSYFAQIRSSDGKAAAEKELEEFTRNGVIPKKFVASASTGARGKLGH